MKPAIDLTYIRAVLGEFLIPYQSVDVFEDGICGVTCSPDKVPYVKRHIEWAGFAVTQAVRVTSEKSVVWFRVNELVATR
jgi:hypothetical protein